MDGEVEYVLDEAYSEMVDLLPCTLTRRKIGALLQRQRSLQAELAAPLQPHRPVRRGTANPKERSATRHRVPSLSPRREVGSHSFALLLGMFCLKIAAFLCCLRQGNALASW